MQEQLTYTLILRWSEEQTAYVGQVQEQVGIEGSGSTHEEALASVLEGIRWWQETSTRQPRQPPTQSEPGV